jgi:hypothetical protein
MTAIVPPNQQHYFLTTFAVKTSCVALSSMGWAIGAGFMAAQITFTALEILGGSGHYPGSPLSPGGNVHAEFAALVALFAAGAGLLHGAKVGNQAANYILSHKLFKRDA